MVDFVEEGNTIVDPGWEHFARFTFVPAVQRGRMLFVSGMTAADENGVIVGKGDIVAQTRYIYSKLRAVLESANARPCDVVKTTDFVVTVENYNDTAQVRREFFGTKFPAATGVVVKSLLRPDALIEIEAIAVVPERVQDPEVKAGQ